MKSLSYPLKLSTLLVLLLTISTSARTPSLGDTGVPPEFDCAMRRAAYHYGKHLLPRRGNFPELFEAAGLGSACGEEIPQVSHASSPPTDDIVAMKRRLDSIPSDAVFVAPGNGDQTRNFREAGTRDAPLSDIQSAMEVALSRESKTVVLRAGTYYLKETLQVEARHSGLHIQAFPGESPVVSGGKRLDVKWCPVDVEGNKNVYVSDLSGQVESVPGLQLNGVRATRARYPNLPGGIEVSPGYGAMIPHKEGTWTPPDLNKLGEIQFHTDMLPEHTRNDSTKGFFRNYMIGIGGTCDIYDPPVSYWCSEHTSGGGAFAFRVPTGVAIAKSALPNGPYKNPSQAVLNVWRPARWANWMFDTNHYDPRNNNFTFGRGGFQGARGSNKGGDFFVENVFEELDYPGEFFFNESTKLLYLFYNGTGAPPADLEVVAPQKQVLVNVTGTQWNPVRAVTFDGITYKASAYTYMMPHGVPSAGDWALERYAAVFMEGTENVTMTNCIFDRLDGNAVMISGYNRHTHVLHSDFSYLGGNAVAAWGRTNETSGDGHPHAGIDGTDGNHPEYTLMKGCSVREVGLYEKQSSFFVQAKTTLTKIEGNVMFNGPRAGINFNDGFGGGDVIERNLVFSTCRESGDHGPFNSWDRQPFLTLTRTRKPSMYMAWREIHHNFFIDNYSQQENVDNDDGSGYYRTHHNFLVYGSQGLKNDFGGHDNWHFENIYAYLIKPIGDGARQLPHHEDRFYGNRVVMQSSDIGYMECKGTAQTVVHSNGYFTPDGKIKECGRDLKDWQSTGEDVNSTVAKHPPVATIIAWAESLLGFEST